MDPPLMTQVYQARAASESSTVALRLISVGLPDKKTQYGRPPVIRFYDTAGSIWEVNVSGNDPELWEVWVATAGQEARRVPLRLIPKKGLFRDWPESLPQFKYPPPDKQGLPPISEHTNTGGSTSTTGP